NSAAISYAALELRFAVERLAVHYWRALLNRQPEEKDLRDIRSFRSIENRIYELGGHQKEIDGHFEFMRIVLGALKIDTSFETPKMGKLSNNWHSCSEYCHVAWPLASMMPEARSGAFADLTEVSNSLSRHIKSLGWPVLQDATFVELRNKFVNGEVSSHEVLEYVRKIGLYAVEKPAGDAPARFVGTAVPPQSEVDQ
ncbi:MAG: hypothetical protein ACREBW_02380, partial [Candidatus Micrarchaeaceae archaeon]